LARLLKLDLVLDIWKKIIVEGDAKKFDYSVWVKFVDLFYSSMLIYEKPNSAPYWAKERLLKVVIGEVLCRVTHLFGPVWGQVVGGVPSGCYNTSHMDSWIMLLWIALFGIFQVINAPEEHQERLENLLLNMFGVITYGDDLLYNPTDDEELSPYLSGEAFSSFMKQYFDVDIRDVKSNLQFCSREKNGFLYETGATYLRHQAVENPLHKTDSKQCHLLPYRESREFLIRAAYGRTPRVRDCFDVILSTIGHAYGTYGANWDAYDRLFFIFDGCCKVLGIEKGEIGDRIRRRLTTDDIKDLRRKGVRVQDILNGFPTRQEIIGRNVWDEAYHAFNFKVETDQQYAATEFGDDW
jgi:hypothetical protein